MDWDKYFMSLVYLMSMKSKDENTKQGAVIVGPDNEIRSTGYNGFPRGLNDNIKERQERPEKYFWFEHAERNAIYNAVRHGTPLKGCRMYTGGVPCSDCARGIIQAGINKVIVHKLWNESNNEMWIEHSKRTIQMFKECGVELEFYDGEIIEKITGRNNKKDVKLNY